jgi:hypothetical protein
MLNMFLSSQHAKVVVGTSNNHAQLGSSDFKVAKKEWENILLLKDDRMDLVMERVM